MHSSPCEALDVLALNRTGRERTIWVRLLLVERTVGVSLRDLIRVERAARGEPTSDAVGFIDKRAESL